MFFISIKSRKKVPLLFCFLLLTALNIKAQNAKIPHLEKRGKATQLIVNDQPFLVLGGELRNSTASSTAYMQPFWKPLAEANFNTILASVSWELVEPEEGKFDFSSVDDLVKGARKTGLKLSLLWFGSWKNGLSHYVPAWVKKDGKRFPYMRLKNGKPVEAITPISEEAMKADAKAFAALMKHVKVLDEKEQTVIMMQVQNEVGLIGGPRDYSEAATKLYAQGVPASLLAYMQKNKETLLPEYRQLWAAAGFRTNGSWVDVFGDNPSAEEAFMAWHYARYINKVAEAGKAQYALPMFVNAWIVQPEDLGPGDYPSGGPQAHVHDIWRAGAPSIDLFCPDIYLPNFDEIAALYTRSGNALFVPESRNDAAGAANAFYAIGEHKAIGYSPFGIDRNGMENVANAPLAKAYAVLSSLTLQILAAQTKGTMAGIWLHPKKKKGVFSLGGYRVEVALRNSMWRQEAVPEHGYGLIIAEGEDEFIIAGKDIQFNFFESSSTGYVGIASIEEGNFVDGKWVAGRRLNGDDIMYNYRIADEVAMQKNGTVVRLGGDDVQVLRVKLYYYE